MSKKIISVLLSVLLAFSVLSVCAFAADETPLKVTVTSDVHVNFSDSTTPNDVLYTDYTDLGVLSDAAPAIFDAFLKEAAANDSQFLLISGDLVNDQTTASAQQMAALLSAFEQSSGKKVFVINGNHDVTSSGDASKCSVAQFKDIYKDFGYSEALAVDTDTCSYTADLSDGYRLIAIDSCERPGDGGGVISAALLTWIESQVKQAKDDGVKLVGMMHHGLMEHFTLQSKLFSRYVISNSSDVCADFASWGIKYVFTGHFHANDIALYEGDSANVYDCETTSLSSYPCAYRTASFSASGVSIKTSYLSSIDTSLLPASFGEANKAAIGADLQGFAYDSFKNAVAKFTAAYATPAKLESLMGVTADSQEGKALEKIVPLMAADLNIPLYKADAGDGDSIESKADTLDIKLEASEFKTVNDLVAFFIAAHMKGDENYPASAPQTKLMIECVVVMFGADSSMITDSEKDIITGKFFDSMGLSSVSSALKFTDLSSALEGSPVDPFGALYQTALNTVLDGITVDKAPADNNVNLPSYADSSNEGVFMKFVNKIYTLLMKLLDFLKVLFKVA